MFYQFWLNQSDASVGDYLKLFTMLSLEEIAVIIEAHQKNPSARLAQSTLAYEVTALVHSKESATAIKNVSATLFGEKKLEELNPTEANILLANAPTFTLGESMSIIDLLVTAGLATSKREARTFVTEGAVSIDGVKITDTELAVTSNSKLRTLRRGQKHYVVLC